VSLDKLDKFDRPSKTEGLASVAMSEFGLSYF
jgi:hypothetical protein